MQEGYEDGEHIVMQCEEMWRTEAKREQKWRTWEDLDDKRRIVSVQREGCIVLYLQPILNPKSYDGARVSERGRQGG